jgi:hypothetical protein
MCRPGAKRLTILFIVIVVVVVIVVISSSCCCCCGRGVGRSSAMATPGSKGSTGSHGAASHVVLRRRTSELGRACKSSG